MNLTALTSQFVSIFLGAFLAFVTEHYRYKRRLYTWLQRYLASVVGQWQADAENTRESLARIERTVSAIDQLLAAPGPDALAAVDWSVLASTTITRMMNELEPVFRTDAIRVLPAELVSELQRLSELDAGVALYSDYVNRFLHDYLLPILFERSFPLSATQRRYLNYYQGVLREWRGAMQAHLAHQTQLIARLREEFLPHG